MSEYEILLAARSAERLTVKTVFEHLFQDFHELHGDRFGEDDATILGGLAYFNEKPVTVIGQWREKKPPLAAQSRYGMPLPAGYRKAARLMKQAEKFKRPILLFIDTPGAFPGIAAEHQTQALAIAENLALMSQLKVPIIATVLGEGGSGGALALGVCDYLLMLKNTVYSVVSPEACATILWKDERQAPKACEALKLTAEALYHLDICDNIISEGEKPLETLIQLNKALDQALAQLLTLTPGQLVKNRYDKYRKVGVQHV